MAYTLSTPSELELLSDAKNAQEDAKYREKALGQIDSVALNPEGYFKDKDFGNVKDRERVKRMAINSAFMDFATDGAEISGLESDMGRTMWRAKIAREHFDGRGAESEEAFHAEIVKGATRRKDSRDLERTIAAAAMDDAMMPAHEGRKGFAGWRKKAESMPGYSPDKQADYAEKYSQKTQEMENDIAPIRDVLDKTWKAFSKPAESSLATPVTPKTLLTGEASRPSMAKATVLDLPSKEIADLSDEDFKQYLVALRLRSETLPDKEKEAFWEGMRKDFARSMESFVRQTGEGMSSIGFNSAFMGPASGGSVPISPETENLLKSIEADFNRQRNRAHEVRQIFDSQFDVIDYAEGLGWLQKAPGVTASSMTMAIPVVGQPIMAAQMLGSSQESMYLQLRSQGLSEDKAGQYADVLAPVVAAPQFALEKVGFGLWANKLPVVSQLLTNISNKVTNRAARFALRTGLITVGESVVEVNQDFTESVVQDVASAIDEEIPGRDLGAEFVSSWKQFPEIAGSMLFLSVLGAAGGLNAEARAEAFAKTDRRERAAWGVSDEANDQIDQAAEAGPASLVQAVDQALANRDPNSETAKAASEELAEEARQQLAAMREAKASGMMPDIIQSRAADGSMRYTVLDGETKEEVGTVDTMPAAMRMAEAHSAAFDNRKAERTAYLATMLEGGAEALDWAGDPNAKNSVETGTLYTETVAAAESPASIDQFAKQAALKEKINGGSGEVTMAAVGRNVAEVRGLVRTFTNRLFRGASVLTLVHETGHGMLRRAQEAGAITRDETVQFVKAVHEVVKGRVFKGEKTDLLPDNFDELSVEDQDTAIGEAFSEILEAEVLRTRRKDKNDKSVKLSGGIISRNLKALSSLVAGPTAKFKAILEAVRGVLGLAAPRAMMLRKGIREGTIQESDISAFIDKVTGRDHQAEHDGMVRDEHAALVGQEAFTPTEDAPFSLVPRARSFEADVDAVLDGTYDMTKPIQMGETPRVFQLAGANALPLSMPPTVIKKAVDGKHDLPRELVKQVASSIHDPVFVFESETVPDALTVILDLTHYGESVLVAVHLDKKQQQHEVNLVASIYDKSNPRALEGWIKDGMLRYIHTQKGRDWFRSRGLQLPKEGTPRGNKNLRTEADLVKGENFSLRPVAMIDALQVNAASRIKDPRVKAGMFTRMLEKLGNLKRDRDEIGIAFGKGYRRKAIEDPRKTTSIRKEAAMREALRREELEDEAHARHGGILHEDDLSKLWNNPVWERIANPDDKLHGRLLSLAAWKRRNPGESVGAEYDGSGDIPRVAFGGEINPAEMAQELYDAGLIPHPTPDALWAALKREAASVEKIKQMMDAAREDVRKARQQAKEESTAWMNDRLTEEAANYSPRQRLLRALATLDAILSVLPAEVRGKIGGYTQLAKLTSDEARLKFLNERIERAEKEVDTWIKGEHRKELATLLEKSKPKKNKPGEAKRGKIGVDAHRIFSWATKYAPLDETQVDAERIAIENERQRIADESVPGIVHPDLLELSNRERALDLVGDFENKSPADQSAALSWLRGTYTFGRDEWQSKESERLAEVAHYQRVVIEELARQKGVKLPSLKLPKFDNRKINGMTAEEAEPILRDHDTRVRNVLAKHKAALRKALEEGGVGSLASRQEKEREEQRKEARTMLEAGTGEFISFVQVLERLLGPGHPLAEKWNAAVGEAQMQKTEAMLEADAAWLKAASEALGNPGKLKVQERLWQMSAEQTVTIEKAIREPGSELEVRVSNVPGLLDGTLDPESHGMTADDLPALQEAWDAHEARTDKGKERTEFLTFKTVGERTTQEVKLTAMQAITLVLTARQARYAKNLELHGFTPDVVASAAAQIGTEGLAMAEWLAEYYRENYEPLAKVFRDMFGVDLPLEENYSPGRFERGGVDKEIGGPQEAGMVPEGGFRANFTKTRAPSHQLAPALLGAVSVFQGHVASTEHWRAFAPLVREMKAVLGGLETRQAIEAVHGKALVNALDGWMLALEQNGLKQRKMADGVDRAIRGMQGNIAILGLAFRFSTIVKNYLLPAFGSARRIGMLNWLHGLARVANGQVSYRKFRESRVVTLRERAGFSPEMKLATAKMLSQRPSRLRNAVIRAMEQIAVADARSTALSAAISWDYHYREAAANGLSAEDAANLADARMIDDVRRTAQPLELAERSLYELSSSEAGRLLFLFATDARKETAIFAEAMRRAYQENGTKGLLTSQEFRRAATAIWLTTGLLNTVISRVLADVMDGGDDDWLDEKNWSIQSLLASALLGPAGGIPLIRDLVSGFSQGEMTKPLRGIQALGNLIEAAWEGDIPDENRVLWIERQINKIMVGAGLFHRGAAEMGAFSNLLDQVTRAGSSASEATKD